MSDAPTASVVPKKALRLITAACALALLGVAVSLAHFIWATPLLFALFMIVGQGSFGLALVLYGIVIFTDLKRQKVL